MSEYRWFWVSWTLVGLVVSVYGWILRCALEEIRPSERLRLGVYALAGLPLLGATLTLTWFLLLGEVHLILWWMHQMLAVTGALMLFERVLETRWIRGWTLFRIMDRVWIDGTLIGSLAGLIGVLEPLHRGWAYVAVMLVWLAHVWTSSTTNSHDIKA